jgi:hypothetical protein
MVFSRPDEQFDDAATEEQRFEADRPGYGFGEMEQELKCRG